MAALYAYLILGMIISAACLISPISRQSFANCAENCGKVKAVAKAVWLAIYIPFIWGIGFMVALYGVARYGLDNKKPCSA